MLIVAGTAGWLAACNGWPEAGDHAQAQTTPEKYPSYAAAQPAAPTIEFDGRHWMVSPNTEELIGARLQQVGSAGQLSIYAAPGAQTPYATLYAPAGGTKWHRVLPID